MTIKLAFAGRKPIFIPILEHIIALSKGEIEIVMTIGKKSADFNAASIQQISARSSKSGPLVANRQYSGAAEPIIQILNLLRIRDEFIDHMSRRAHEGQKNHQLRALDEYHNYFSIHYDALAAELIERKVTHVLMMDIPHRAYDTSLYHIANALNIPTYVMAQSLFGDRFFSMKTVEQNGVFRTVEVSPPFSIEKKEECSYFYMGNIGKNNERRGRFDIKRGMKLINFIKRQPIIEMLNPFLSFSYIKTINKIMGKFPHWRDPFAEFFDTSEMDYFCHLMKFENKPPNLEGRFVYFPLQLQPEMTTSALGGRFVDQAYAIERLSAILPDDVRILVKENPKHGAYRRGPMFFHRLRRIAKVEFLPSYSDTNQLVKRSMFVATVTGTAGWEAISLGKPALVFGIPWYRSFPGVIEYRDGVTFDEIMGQNWERSELEERLGALLYRSHEGIVVPGYEALVQDYDEARNIEKVAHVIHGLLMGKIETTFG